MTTDVGIAGISCEINLGGRIGTIGSILFAEVRRCNGNSRIFPRFHAPPGGTGLAVRRQRNIMQLCVAERILRIWGFFCEELAQDDGTWGQWIISM